MARITVEDCITRVPNRFELIMLAAHRARELSKGVPSTVALDNDKSHVVALREIAEGMIEPATITDSLQKALLGTDDEDQLPDEADEVEFRMEAPARKFDFDQAIRDWEKEEGAGTAEDEVDDAMASLQDVEQDREISAEFDGGFDMPVEGNRDEP